MSKNSPWIPPITIILLHTTTKKYTIYKEKKEYERQAGL